MGKTPKVNNPYRGSPGPWHLLSPLIAARSDCRAMDSTGSRGETVAGGLVQEYWPHSRPAGCHGWCAGLLAVHDFAYQRFLATSRTVVEKTVVWQAVNVEQNCHCCLPAHTHIAKRMKVDDATTEALRNETPLPTPKLEALRDFTRRIVRNRGVVDEAGAQAFLAAGFTQTNVLEIILGVAPKVMSNYTNHVAQMPVDTVFQKFAWLAGENSA